jgi:hypothetical protein
VVTISAPGSGLAAGDAHMAPRSPGDSGAAEGLDALSGATGFRADLRLLSSTAENAAPAQRALGDTGEARSSDHEPVST